MGGEAISVSLNRDEMVMPGFGVSVLPLQNVSAEAMLRLLENFISKGGSLKAETTGNLLLVRGTANERRTLMDVAASFDVDWLKGQSAGIFPLTHSTPDELIAELTQTMQAEQGDLVAKMVRFQPIHRLNAVLVLSRQSSHLKKAAEWIKRLDRSNAAGQSLYVYRVENGKAQDLAALLNDTLGGEHRRTPVAHRGRAGQGGAEPRRQGHAAVQSAAGRALAFRQARPACSRRWLRCNGRPRRRETRRHRVPAPHRHRPRRTFASFPTRSTTCSSSRPVPATTSGSWVCCAGSIGRRCR